MTNDRVPPHDEQTAQEQSDFFVARLPAPTWLKNLNIGPKLSIGFGALVLLVLLVVAVSFVASAGAQQTMRATNQLRYPAAATATAAQVDLLLMQSNVRGYLALGEDVYREAFEAAQASFEANLASLNDLELSSLNQARLAELEAAYADWKTLPGQLFTLRNDRLEREPAYRVLATDGVLFGGQVLLDLNNMIDAQALQTPTTDNIRLLKDMADFQGSFAAMLSGLRNYVTTQNRIFRQEYEANLVLNDLAWESLQDGVDGLTETQQALLQDIRLNRDKFLDLPEYRIFPVLEAEDGSYRQDLYLFSTQAVPQADLMLDLLADITADEQRLLKDELNRSNSSLGTARSQTVIWGVVAVLAGGILAYILRSTLVAPVTILTNVAERIRAGDLEAHAPVVFNDEVGLLAQTFNRMTTRLRETLQQVRKEKKRADDLLNVVIPIGVELTSEQDFNRLLEKMLVEAKTFCNADAGSLYLRTEDDHLRFVIVRNDTQNLALGGTTGKEITFPPLALYDADGQSNWRNIAAYTALTGNSMNIEEVYAPDGTLEFSGPREFDARIGYRSKSMLTIPLKNVLDEVIGVLQLINAKDPETGEIIPFDANIQQMMESFSSLAVAALEAYKREQALRQEIQQLRIEIDEAKLQQQVKETVETDFFQDLQAKAQDIRQRRQRTKSGNQ
ncbi:MAG: HAMP domain-containing protein [Anaerolineales bacterium]|nr:HAMP domain-containing protein [Anaerolineales bacterium]MCA9975728.1 HAMP domain-containing protein [Anaerolineales bacterium]